MPRCRRFAVRLRLPGELGSPVVLSVWMHELRIAITGKVPVNFACSVHVAWTRGSAQPLSVAAQES